MHIPLFSSPLTCSSTCLLFGFALMEITVVYILVGLACLHECYGDVQNCVLSNFFLFLIFLGLFITSRML
jgi:hypothetical protein